MSSLDETLAALEAALPTDLNEVATATSLAAIESHRIRLMGRRSGVVLAAADMKTADPSDRPDLGRRITALRHAIEGALAAREEAVAAAETSARLASERVDLSLPGRPKPRGFEHLITRVMREVEDLFVGLGYRVAEGPEVETDWFCFEALNIPKVHPARSMQDTLYVESDGAADGEVLMRSHTSSVQIRTMLAEKPPLYIIAPGRTARRDTVDATHIPVFHQFECLAVDEGITFGHLAGTLEHLARSLFGPERELRLRPSYFPYTEPSAEIDISCFICRGSGLAPDGSGRCPTCKGSGWIEMGGSGMVHPEVLERVGYDPEVVSGFAFGMGIERIALLRHGIPDMRLFLENDLRFLEQFV